jgi:hypothetical protein
MKFLNGESTTRALDFGLATVFAITSGFAFRSGLAFTSGFAFNSAFAFTSALALTSAFVFTIAFAFVLVFALGLAVVDFVAIGFAVAVFFRIFAAISVVRSSPKHWPLVVGERGPLNEGRVRYQKISGMAIRIVGAGMTGFRLEIAAGPRRFPGLDRTFGPAVADVAAGSDNRTIEGLEMNRVGDGGRRAEFVLRRDGVHR